MTKKRTPLPIGFPTRSVGTNLRSYTVKLDDETRSILRSIPGSMSAAIREIVKGHGERKA